jgi:general secretion pathway protein D
MLRFAFSMGAVLCNSPLIASLARISRRAAFLLALALVPGALIMPSHLLAADGAPITLNFKDAEIDSVIGAFGHLLNRTFIIDPRVRGKVSLETPKAVSPAKALEMLQSVLRAQGFAMVEAGGLTKVVPEADAKLQAGPVSAGRLGAAAGEQIVTQIFKLNYESASNLVPVLRPLIAPNNTITAYPNNNSLVITDYASNLQRVARIIASLDLPSTNEVEVVSVKNVIASDIALQVARLLDDSQRAGAGVQIDPGQRISVLADSRMNAILLRSTSAAKMNMAKSLISRMDQPLVSPGNIHVVYLRNAEAVKLAQTLRAVMTGDGSGSGAGGAGSQPLSTPGQPLSSALGQASGPGQGAGGLSAQQPLNQTQNNPVVVSAGGAVIAADPTTNSLIITASEPVYRNLRSVIEKLDARRAQVFIESLIVEVNADRAAEMGIQWQFLNLGSGGKAQVFGGTNLPGGTGPGILSVAANPTAIGNGLNVGVVRGGGSTIPDGKGGTISILNLGLLAKALESGASGNVLATPNLLTLDNEEARIIIGQNVPFVTGQFTTLQAGSNANPFQTVERKDVGTTLRVKPQVSESGTVRMQIFQEVSSVVDATLSAGLITNKRAIESNVLVDDGQIVVLGGLIEERIESGETKVPGLGDIPFFGNLFKSQSRKRVKTNLLVFLRPVIIRDAEAAYSVTSDRYDFIRQLRGDARLPSHFLLPDMKPADLPGMPPPPSSGGGRPVSRDEKEGPVRAPGYQLPPASMAPELDNRARRNAPVESSRGIQVIQTAPNEAVISIPVPAPETTVSPSTPAPKPVN